ncbi:GntR family transcriptional regulator [Lederbergia sp. NSJ-179]|uniref:GntR family transcriptional regulator n=1 Tax=Lederbergia sp. NSJ-179 TaxID=2931402 RepID=UPI001FD0FB30|nr:GntR family transcriptional regulator [Lederbergia sp. NSJ-179]MCJ7842966.1 GntR family transcriptional regulator [Lederbergia sp. NSJ-179]
MKLKEAIENNEIKEGEKIPSEKELQEIFGVSRITVRKAMEDLENDQLVKKYQGKGTIVMPTKHNYNLQELTSFSSDVQQAGGVSSSIILDFKVVEANVKVANNLNIDLGESVYHLKRLRMMGDKIVGLHDAYIKKRGSVIISPEEINNHTSLYKLLNDKGINLKFANEILEARIPDEKTKKLLKLNNKQAIFFKERITYDHNNNPIEYVEIYYNADIYRYKVSMSLKGE